ncbi:MAG: 4-(cytidine 5'-diphospho)-2-C-methyl-D-erythritol kinase, partial [Pseudohongiellaceae bacterium]
MDQLKLLAPAKLNLFLNILGQRDDGYHELQTLFQFLDYCDILTFIDAGQDIYLDCDQLTLPPSENLVYRAAKLLQQAGGYTRGAKISLVKRIPAGAGLGGASSDAATALVGLNRIWRTGLDQADLLGLAARLGADVPVFVAGHSAWAEGIGDRLQPVELPQKWYLVVFPACHVSTAEVFTHPDLTRNGTPITIARFLEQGAANACEAAVRRLYPPVDEAFRWLSQWGAARMTGTGSCVFLDLESASDANKLLTAVPSQWKAFVAEGINIS